MGVLCFVMALVVLAFFSSVLLNIVDAVFMCYALDLDTQSVTKSEVHEVFSQVSMSLSWQLHEHLLGSMPFLGCNWFATADLHLLTQSLSVVSLMLM